MIIAPTQIDKASPTELLLAWNNGERYALPFVELRYQCPCASCVDEHTGVRTIKRESIDPAIRPVGVQLIGRYAVQIDWSDGHNTGMFHYEGLFDLCGKKGRKLS